MRTVVSINLICLTFIEHPTFFSSAYESFAKTDHIADYKTSVNKYKIIQIIQCMFRDYNEIKSEISIWKILKYLETHVHTSKWLMGSKKKSQKNQ